MTLPYPYPQTAGRDRHILTVDQTTFDGLPFRPTQTQAESLFRTDVYSGVDWYGTPYELQFSQQANIEESKAKAAIIGGEAGGGIFAGIWDIFSKVGVETFDTIADKFMVTYNLQEQSRTAGSPVPGNPPAPGEIHYTAAQREQIIKERIVAAKDIVGSLVSQVKGLFNMGYPSPYETKTGGTPAAPPKKLPAGIAAAAVVVLLLYMVT